MIVYFTQAELNTTFVEPFNIRLINMGNSKKKF